MLQEFACHPCSGAMLIFSVLFHFTICAAKVSTHCSFDELVGEKVVSPSYSSAFLGNPKKSIDI